jgi:hypothetical protein
MNNQHVGSLGTALLDRDDGLQTARGSSRAAFTVNAQIYLRRRLDAFVNPLVYTFQGSHDPPIMT